MIKLLPKLVLKKGGKIDEKAKKKKRKNSGDESSSEEDEDETSPKLEGDEKKEKKTDEAKKEEDNVPKEDDPVSIPIESSLLKKKRFQYFQDRRERLERERVAKEDEEARKAEQQKRFAEVEQMQWEERRMWDVIELPERNRMRLKRDHDALSELQAKEAKRKAEEEQTMKEDGLTYCHRVVDKDRRWKSTDALMSTFPGHTSHVYSLKLSKNGLNLLTCSADETLKLWDIASKECILTMKGHVRPIRDCDISPMFDLRRPDLRSENNIFLSASQDKTLRVYLYPNTTSLHVLYGHKDSVLGVTFAPDGVRAVSCSADATLRMWDVVEGHCLYTYLYARLPTQLKESINCCRFSPSGRYIVAGSGYAERVVRLWYGGMPILYEPDEIAVRIKWQVGGLIRKIQLQKRATKEFMLNEYDEYSPDEYEKSDEEEEKKEEAENEELDPYGMLSEEDKKKKKKPKEEDCRSCQIPDCPDQFGCSLAVCTVDRFGKLDRIKDYIPGDVFTILLQSMEQPFDMFHITCVKKQGEFSVYQPTSGERCGIFVQTSVPPGVKLSVGRILAASLDNQKNQEIRLRWRAPPLKTGTIVFKANLRIPRVGKAPRMVMLRITLKEGEPVYGNILQKQKRKRKMIKPKVDLQMRHILFQEYVEAKDLKSAAMMVDDNCKFEDLGGQKIQGKEEVLSVLRTRIMKGSIFKKVNKIGLVETTNKVIRELKPLIIEEEEEAPPSGNLSSRSSVVSALTERESVMGGDKPSMLLKRTPFQEQMASKQMQENHSSSDEKEETLEGGRYAGIADQLLASAFPTRNFQRQVRRELKRVAQMRKAGLACAEEVRSVYVPSGFTMPTQSTFYFSGFHLLPHSVDSYIKDQEAVTENNIKLKFEVFKDGLFGAEDLPHLRMRLPPSYPHRSRHPVAFARPALEKAAVLKDLETRLRHVQEIKEARVAMNKPVDAVVEEIVDRMMQKNRKILLESLERRNAFPDAPGFGSDVKFTDSSYLGGHGLVLPQLETSEVSAGKRAHHLFGHKQKPRQGRRGSLGILPGFESGNPHNRGYIDHDAEKAERNGGLVRNFNDGRVCHSDSIQCTVFSMDESRVASGSSDGVIKLWDPGLGRFIRSLELHRFSVQGLCFSSDGVFLASCSVDMTIILWEVERGMPVQTMRGHTDIVHAVIFASKDNALFSCSSDGTVKGWCVTPSAPLPPERPEGIPMSKTEVLLTWKPAPAFNTPFTAFRISWRRGVRGEFRHEISVNGREYRRKVKGLDSGCAYQFRVCAVNRMGKGDWSEHSPTVVTFLDVPDAAARPEVIEATCTSITIFWFVKRATIPEARLQHFRIQLAGDGRDFGEGQERLYPFVKCRDDAREYFEKLKQARRLDKSLRKKLKRPEWGLVLAEWDGLDPGKGYRFRMSSTNSVGEGPFSLPSLTFYTKPQVPDQPQPPYVTEISTHSLLVNWVPPNDRGSTIKQFRIRMCMEDAPVILADRFANSHLFDNLSPGIKYSFQVLAVNLAGAGKWSDPSTPVSTQTDIPAAPAPPLVISATPVEVILYVKRPEGNGERVTNYKAQCREYSTGRRYFRLDQLFKKDPELEKVQLRFVGLNPDSFYSFRVCAINLHGPSEYSTPSRWIRTPPAKVPETPFGLEVEVTSASNNGISACVLTWQAPKDGGAPILEYLVEFCVKTTKLQLDPQNWDQETVDETDEDEIVQATCAIENLPGGLQYKFRVSAKNIVGWGPVSDPLLLEAEDSESD